MLQHSKRTFSSLFMLCSEEENSGWTDKQMDSRPHEYCPAARQNYKPFPTAVHFPNAISLRQHYWPTLVCPTPGGELPLRHATPRHATPRAGSSRIRRARARARDRDRDHLVCAGAWGWGGRRGQSALTPEDPLSLTAWLALAGQLIQANGNSACLLSLFRMLAFFPELTSKNAHRKSRRDLAQIIRGGFWATA